MLLKINMRFIIVILSLSIFSCEREIKHTPVPFSCRQSILVLTDSLRATNGSLYCFERDGGASAWQLKYSDIPVVLGRSGLGWGRGLHDSSDTYGYPLKAEGDGRSPAGVFLLSAVFGYAPADQMDTLKMPYIHITEAVECVDDAHSVYYNQVVSRDDINETTQVDWQSSEKMRSAGIYYERGVVVEHNTDPVKPSAGSCIFLHNWADPNETMAGCTGMAPAHMKTIVSWLDASKQPVLVQLTKLTYRELQEQWQLPLLMQE